MQRSGFFMTETDSHSGLVVMCCSICLNLYDFLPCCISSPLPSHTAEDLEQCVASRQPRRVCMVCLSLRGDSECTKIFAMQPVMLCALRWRPQHRINNSTEFTWTLLPAASQLQILFKSCAGQNSPRTNNNNACRNEGNKSALARPEHADTVNVNESILAQNWDRDPDQLFTLSQRLLSP